MPELVGLTDERLVFSLLCVLVQVFSNTTDVVRAGTRWEPVGNPLGTRWEPGLRHRYYRWLEVAGDLPCRAATW